MSSSSSVPPPPVPWHFNIHHVAPALATAFALSAVTRGWTTALGAGALMSIVAHLAINRIFPVKSIQPYRAVMPSAATDVESQITSKQRFNVGFRYVHADGKGLPHCSLFYPTEDPLTQDESKLPRFAPLNDIRYAAGFARYARAPQLLANHQLRVKMHVAVDAPVAPSAIEHWGKPQHPVVIFSHGLAGHQHMYSNFALDLAAMGAIVLCVQHTDGSACFALQPPDSNTPSPQQHLEIPYKLPPEDDAHNAFSFRQHQIKTVRIPELTSVIRFAASNLIKKALSVPITNPNDKTPVSLIGHSFGSTTVVSAAVNFASTTTPGISIPAVVALDLWTEPIHTEHFHASVAEAAPKLPPLLLLDSEQWERWTLNRDNELRLMALWSKADPSRVVRNFLVGTDHLTLSVMSNIVNLQRPRKKYCKKELDRQHAAVWAHQAFDFVATKL